MKRVLVDGDLLLECCIVGNSNKDTEQFMEIVKSQQIKLYITDRCLDGIKFYVYKQQGDNKNARDLIQKVEDHVKILLIENKFINEATQLLLLDFDSAIEIICAKHNKMDAIITRNPHNFNGSDVPIWSAENVIPRIHLSNCLSLEIDVLQGFYPMDTAIPSFNSMEAVDVMKYKIRHSITTVMEVFRLLEEECNQGISRQELQKKYNYRKNSDYTENTINSIILDLQNFHMVTTKSGNVYIQPYLVGLDNIAIANHIAQFLSQHILVQTINKQIKTNKCFTRAYLQKLMMQLEQGDDCYSKQTNEYKGEFLSLPLGFNLYIDSNLIANKSASDYISRMLGWLLFTGLLEKKNGAIIIPINEGKQKGQLIEDNSTEQLDSLHKQLDLF
ncbi:MAG TPA: PIN domain-containing protein [Leptolyngbyaceae cyanobacterium]